MEISRSFDRRGGDKSEAGHVGHITMVVPDGAWTITVVGGDGTKQSGTIPANIVAVLVEQAMSPFTDSYAGDSAIGAAVASFNDKARRFLAGEYRTRAGSGASVDPVTVQVRRIVAAAIRAADEKREEKAWPALDAMTPSERNAALDAKFAEQKKGIRESIMADAEAAVEKAKAAAAERAAQKAQAAKLAGGF